MNKQEAAEKIKASAWSDLDAMQEVVGANYAIAVISQINEPQKVVIPKFVAEWIEVHKRNNPFISTLFTDNKTKELTEWLDLATNQEKLVCAWIDGYEVEQEKLYTVPLGNKFLVKGTKGNHVRFFVLSGFETKDGYVLERQITEREIKNHDERYWPFAVPVEVE